MDFLPYKDWTPGDDADEDALRKIILSQNEQIQALYEYVKFLADRQNAIAEVLMTNYEFTGKMGEIVKLLVASNNELDQKVAKINGGEACSGQ